MAELYRAQQARFGQSFGDLVTVGIGKRLQDLDAAAMAVHIAEAADIHQDVKAQALASGELAQTARRGGRGGGRRGR